MIPVPCARSFNWCRIDGPNGYLSLSLHQHFHQRYSVGHVSICCWQYISLWLHAMLLTRPLPSCSPTIFIALPSSFTCVSTLLTFIFIHVGRQVFIHSFLRLRKYISERVNSTCDIELTKQVKWMTRTYFLYIYIYSLFLWQKAARAVIRCLSSNDQESKKHRQLTLGTLIQQLHLLTTAQFFLIRKGPKSNDSVSSACAAQRVANLKFVASVSLASSIRYVWWPLTTKTKKTAMATTNNMNGG